jgi:N-acyl-D-amino-acid deacylase
MLSWANVSLIADGKSQSDIRQGVTLEVMGEGTSMGPLTESMKRDNIEQQGDIKYDIEWTSLGEYLDYLVARGISCNIASFIGATTARINILNHEDRLPDVSELVQMQDIVRQGMEQGAVGVSSALIYPPATYSNTDELIALARAAAEYGGMFISHIRNENDRILDALDEFITIARNAEIASEIYHLKQAGKANWDKHAAVIEKVESARREGLIITADMYLYTASSTGLDSAIPAWAHEGGHRELIARLKDPAMRTRIAQEIRSAPPEDILLVAFRSDALKPLSGKRLVEIAAMREKSAPETIMDLIVEDDSRIGSVFFTMSEENVRREVALPWVSFGSDGQSLAPEGLFLKSGTHPRSYGNFARLLAKYVRDEKTMPLREAVRRLTTFPARNLKLERRGALQTGYFADVVVFDPDKVQDHATYVNPHQYATGMSHVFVNGVQVLKDGEHTGAKPGRVVRGPGY